MTFFCPYRRQTTPVKNHKPDDTSREKYSKAPSPKKRYKKWYCSVHHHASESHYPCRQYITPSPTKKYPFRRRLTSTRYNKQAYLTKLQKKTQQQKSLGGDDDGENYEYVRCVINDFFCAQECGCVESASSAMMVMMTGGCSVTIAHAGFIPNVQI